MWYKKQLWIYFSVILTLAASLTFAWYNSNHEIVRSKTVSKALEQKNIAINVDTLAKPKSGSVWIGSWERKEEFEGGSFDIDTISNNSFKFDITAANGGHSGEIEGIAKVQNNTAIFTAKNGCSLIFKRYADSLIEIIANQKCQLYAGIGVGFDGKYYNRKKLPKPKVETMIAKYLLTTDEDAVFRKMVDTCYHTFVNCSQLIAQGDEDTKDRDNLNVRVISAGVRGLYTYMEQIILIDKDKHIWAAVIDDQKVRYFTNVGEYKDKLPKTIEYWRENFKDYPVIYMSKN